MKQKFFERIGQWITPPCIRKSLTDAPLSNSVAHRFLIGFSSVSHRLLSMSLCCPARVATLLLVMGLSVNVWGADTYERLTSIANIDESAQYVLGIDGTGFHYEGTSSWGKTALPSAQTPLYYTLKKAADEQSFTAKTEINKTTYYLQIPTSNTFGMATSTGTNTDLIIGTTYDAGDGKDYAVTNKSTTTRHLRRNGTSGLRSYASTTGAIAFFYKVVKDEKTLTSIAISGTPKTTYETGESFDVTGLTVTGTYDDASTADLTDDAEWTINPATFTFTSQTSVSVTATAGGKSDSKTYNVTVTEHTVTPGTYEISLNNALYGISTGNNGTEQSVTTNDITVVSGCASDASSKTYYAANHIRYYQGSYLKLSVPAGYEITSVVFTADGTWNGSITSTPDAYNADTKTWTGKSQNVDFAFGAQNRVSSIKVTFAAKKVVSGITVKNNPSKTTYYVGDDFDPAGLVITATYTDEFTEDIAYTEANKDAFSFSGFNSEAEATDQVITVTYAEKSATFKVNIETERTLNSITVASNPDKTVYEVGEALDLTGLVVNGIFSKGDPEPVEYTADPEDGTTLDAIGTTTVTLTSVDNTELTTSFNVTVNAIEGDRLTPAAVGNKSSYAEWDNAYVGTYATYIGYAMGGDAKFQLKSSDNVAGIVSTVSGGNIAKVKVTWNSSTTNGRVLDVYGSNVAYTAASDLYDNSKKGTKIGSIKYGESTEFIVSEGEYAYVGIRSASGALYLDNVTFVWTAPKELTSIAIKTAPSKVVYDAGEFFEPTGLEITATYDDASTKDITYDANDTKWSFNPALDVALNATNTQVTITYDGKTAASKQTITVNRIASNLAAVSATKILVVDDMPDVTEWYTIDDNYDGTVSFSSNNTEVFDVEEGTGLAYAAGSATLTITAPPTNTYAQASVTVAVTVNAAPVPCSVKWMNNGEEYTAGEPSTTVNAGQKVTKLPNDPTPCDAQHKFMGWTNAAITTPQADAPGILFTDAASAPTVDADNTVYYAVYAVESLNETIDSYTFASFESAKNVDFTTDGGNTITMNANTGTNPAWNAGASEARLYAKGSMTVSSVETISKIVYSYTVNANSKGVTPTIDGVAGATTAGTWDSESKTWTGSDTEVTFSTSGSAGNIGFTNVTIYTGGGYKYSDYSTTCAKVELDKIELSGTYPTTFLLGDEFSHEGVVVTAKYTNSATTKNVTNLATFSGYDANTLGEQIITVSYTEGEGESAITETATYNVTVNEIPTMTIAEFLANPSKCYLLGLVSDITNTTYGNYTLTDASGSADIYGTLTPSKESKQFESLGVVEGDKIKVIANEYNTQFENIPNVIFVEKIVSPYFTRDDLNDKQLITVCLDKNITSVEGGTFFEIDYGTTSEITFAAITTFPIAEATPLLFESDGSEMKVYCGTDQVDGDKETIVEHRAMKGLVNTATTLQTAITPGNILVSGGKLHTVGAECYLTPGHAYIDAVELEKLEPLQQQAGVTRRRLVLTNDEAQVITGLNAIQVSGKTRKMMINNQMVIIREGKMYNAQGTLMK